ncbi:MAG: ligase-associated DNA damage response exonuclease [Paracoccaceae bacterium]
MAREPLLTFTPNGIYCPDGDFFIDPSRAVDRALVTHGHSDHAYRGHNAYLCTHAALPVIRNRLGRIVAEGIAYGEPRQIGRVTVSFHPAGHVPGSAQIRVERGGEVWVVSGDYKTEADGLCEPFAPIRCHTFITECTFGLPIFQWRPETEILTQIADWWARNAAQGRISILAAYSFGKAQRLMAGIPPQGPIHTHPVVEDITEILREQGYRLPPTHPITDQPVPRNALVIAPPNVLSNDWAHPLAPYATGFASGWMALNARRKSVEAAFTLSDHADWPGLNHAVRATGAERVFVTHGYTEPFYRWLRQQGYDAGIVQ